jgi:hypothetical protein
MSGNDQKVLLVLNSQGFQQELFELDANEIKKVFKTLRKISGHTWAQVYKDHGLKWEEMNC